MTLSRQPAALLLLLAGGIAATAQSTTQDGQTTPPLRPRPAHAASGATGSTGLRAGTPAPVVRVAPLQRTATGATATAGGRPVTGAQATSAAKANPAHSTPSSAATTAAKTAPLNGARPVLLKPRPGEPVKVPGEARVLVKDGAAVALPVGTHPRLPAPAAGAQAATGATRAIGQPATGRSGEAGAVAVPSRTQKPASGTAALEGSKPATSQNPAGATGAKAASQSAGTAHHGTAAGLSGALAAGATASTGAPATHAKPAATPGNATQVGTASPQPSVPAGPPTGPLNRMTIVLDPGHGGVDGGSRIGDRTLEKDVTLQFAFKLRSLLQARGFTVVMTREADLATQPNNPGTPLSLDDRAGIANHARAVACLLLHATGRGNGVHLYRSDLDPAIGETAQLPWMTAQAAWVNDSNALNRELTQAFARSKVPLVSSVASIRPVDSLTCPALVLELAPDDSDSPESIKDTDYQNKVAAAVAGVMIFWENNMQPPVKIVPPPAPRKKTTPAASDDEAADAAVQKTAGATP